MVQDDKNEEERRLDDLIDAIGRQALEEDARTHIIDPQRVRQIEFAFEALHVILKNQDVVIRTRLNEPFKSTGSITVEGKSIVFSKSEWFTRVAKFASNVEVYPLTNGKLRMAFTFHGLAVPV